MNRKEKIDKLLGQSMKIQGELAKLREYCTHTEGYFVDYWSWRAGCIEVNRICGTCQMAVDGITSEEIDKFIKDRKKDA